MATKSNMSTTDSSCNNLVLFVPAAAVRVLPHRAGPFRGGGLLGHQERTTLPVGRPLRVSAAPGTRRHSAQSRRGLQRHPG